MRTRHFDACKADRHDWQRIPLKTLSYFIPNPIPGISDSLGKPLQPRWANDHQDEVGDLQGLIDFRLERKPGDAGDDIQESGVWAVAPAELTGDHVRQVLALLITPSVRNEELWHVVFSGALLRFSGNIAMKF